MGSAVLKGLSPGLLLIALLAAPASAQQPVLVYQPPANTMFQGIDPKEDYAFTNCNASVQIYQFRPFNGDIVKAFQTTLLRDWIAPMHQEERVAAQPGFFTAKTPGAEYVVAARFDDAPLGLPKPHARILIISGNQAAIVDASAASPQCWQVVAPALTAMEESMSVSTGGARPAGSGHRRRRRCRRPLHGHESQVHDDDGQRHGLRDLPALSSLLFVLGRRAGLSPL
jgi:hypothetical protein